MNYLVPEVRGDGLEELPHVWGQGRPDELPHARGRGGGLEELPHNWGQGGGLEELPHVRGQGRQDELPHVRDQGRRDELPHARGQGWRLRRTTACPRSGALAERSYHTPEVRGGGLEELPHVWG